MEKNFNYKNQNTTNCGNQITELENELIKLCQVHSELNDKGLNNTDIESLIERKETDMWTKTNEFLKVR